MSNDALNWVAKAHHIRGVKRAVLWALANRAAFHPGKSEHECCWPSEKTIANEAGVSERTVARCLASLQDDDGAIRIVSRGHKFKDGACNLYELVAVPDTVSGTADKVPDNGAAVPDNGAAVPDSGAEVHDIDAGVPDIPTEVPDSVSGKPKPNPNQNPKENPNQTLGRVVAAPKVHEVVDYAAERKVPARFANDFHQEFEAADWRIDGQRIKSWRAVFDYRWARGNGQPPKRKASREKTRPEATTADPIPPKFLAWHEQHPVWASVGAKTAWETPAARRDFEENTANA